MRSADRQVPDSLKEELLTDYRNASITEFEKLMLAYAEKITKEPWGIDRAFVDFLKERGFTDHILHDIVQVSAYFAYINRISEGLGVELEQPY